MGIRLKFRFLGEEQVNRTLEAFEYRAQDMRPAWDDVKEFFTDYEEKWFGDRGRGWVALSPTYAAWKAKHFPGKPIMQRSGDLLDSLTGPSIDIREPGYAIFGTDVEYAVYHQDGDGQKQRRVIDVDDAGRAEIVRFVQRHLVEEGK
jgi:phage gpG-like protein